MRKKKQNAMDDAIAILQDMKKQLDVKTKEYESQTATMFNEMAQSFLTKASMHVVKGLLVFYINVGMLPPYKAEAFMERMKDMMANGSSLSKERKWKLPDDVGTFWVPTRTGETRLEYIHFGDDRKHVLEQFKEIEAAYIELCKEHHG
jgi:hypothetical protein